MDSLSFTPGEALLTSVSTVAPWSVFFEDEGVAAYFYACDRMQPTEEAGILDAMLVYNVSSLADPTTPRLATIEWSREGLQAVLYLDGTPQALVDFETRTSYCRSNFPNFQQEPTDTWRKSSHVWDDAAMERFESALYA